MAGVCHRPSRERIRRLIRLNHVLSKSCHCCARQDDPRQFGGCLDASTLCYGTQDGLYVPPPHICIPREDTMTTLSGEPAMGSIDLPCTTTSSTSLGRCLLWGWPSAIYGFIACLYKCGPDRPQARHNPSPHSAWDTPRCPWTKPQLATSLLLVAKT